MNLTQTQSKPNYSSQPYCLPSPLDMQPENEKLDSSEILKALVAPPEETKLDSLEMFKAAITDLFIRGMKLRNQVNTAQDTATVALSKILGIAQDIYGKASITEKEELMAYLRQRCRADGMKTITKRTTIFHLLSRQLRGSDTKQASSDAKILDRADKDRQTEQTFCEWVTGLGGLNSIKNNKPNKPPGSSQPKQQSEKTQKSQDGSHERKFVVWLYDDKVPGMFKHLVEEKIYICRLVRLSDGSVKIAVYEEIDKANAATPMEGELDPESEVEESLTEEIA